MELFFFIIVTYLLLLWVLSSDTCFKSVYVIGIIALYWGFSYINAADVPAYMDFFKYCGTGINAVSHIKDPSLLSFEKGFIFYMGWLKIVAGENYYLYQFLTLCIEFSLTYIGLKKLLCDKREVLLFFCIFALQLPFFIAAMRQGLVISIFIYSLPYVVKREYFKCILLYLLSTVFHSSAIFLIGFVCFYWMFWNKLSIFFLNKKIPFYFFITLNLFYFIGLNISNLMSELFLLVLGHVENMERDYTIYAEEFSTATFGILKLLEMNIIFMILFFTSWFKNKMFSNYSILIYLFLIYYVLNLLAGGIVVHRLNYYLNLPYNYMVTILLIFMLVNVLKRSRVFAAFAVLSYYTIFFIIANLFNTNYLCEYHLFDFLNLNI